MRNVLVNVYAPGYQYFEAFMVTCQHKVEMSLLFFNAHPLAPHLMLVPAVTHWKKNWSTAWC